MGKIKYIDNDILCQYDFKEGLFDILDIKVEDIIPLRKIYVLYTNKGKKILKLIEATEERVDFLDKSLKIIEKKFPNVLRYCRNKYGNIITKMDEEKYCLLDMVEGREASYTNPVEVELCTKAMANMHLYSKGIVDKVPIEYVNGNLGENLIDKMKIEFNDLVFIEKIVKSYKYRNEFDEIFLTYVDKAKKDLEKSIEDIQNSSYEKIIKYKEKMVLCHNDLAHHNFIIDGEDVSIIDFDYATIGSRVIDIYGYMTKVSKSLAYDKEAVNCIIKSYNDIEKLEDEEIDILIKLLKYPKDFITISSNYYFKQKRWDEEVFLARLKNKINIDQFREELIKNTN